MIKLLIRYFAGAKAKLFPKESDDYEYSALTPVDDADEDGEYSKALYKALKNKSIKNIAVTGPYGSGKSSVLRTFEKKYKSFHGFKFLNISLGAFSTNSKLDEDNKSKAGSPQNKTDESNLSNALEKSLLQQIIYKVNANKIPESRLKRINKVTFWTNLSVSAIITLSATLIYYFINPTFSFFQDAPSLFEDNKLFIKLFTFLCIIALVQAILNLIPKSTLSKLGLASAEISFNENRGDSVLNKHLDEIIYFFSKTKFNVVIIEDLDRLNEIDPSVALELFTKLREINILLNNSDQINRSLKPPINFVYALGDGVLSSTDRTKFFDFILPIIPVIRTGNHPLC
jgi:dephospho-CoA kinase